MVVVELIVELVQAAQAVVLVVVQQGPLLVSGVLEPLIKDMLAAMAHLVVQQEVVLVVVALAQ